LLKVKHGSHTKSSVDDLRHATALRVKSKIHPRAIWQNALAGSRSRAGVSMKNNSNLAAEQIEQDRDALVVNHVVEEPLRRYGRVV
jgi:hypothetical protein